MLSYLFCSLFSGFINDFALFKLKNIFKLGFNSCRRTKSKGLKVVDLNLIICEVRGQEFFQD